MYDLIWNNTSPVQRRSICKWNAKSGKAHGEPSWQYDGVDTAVRSSARLTEQDRQMVISNNLKHA
jgi:hypothetical protein